MVEKDNQSQKQEYQALQQMLAQDPNQKVSNQLTEETSVWGNIGKIILIILGVIIAIPFLLFITCLGIIASAN